MPLSHICVLTLSYGYTVSANCHCIRDTCDISFVFKVIFFYKAILFINKCFFKWLTKWCFRSIHSKNFSYIIIIYVKNSTGDWLASVDLHTKFFHQIPININSKS